MAAARLGARALVLSLALAATPAPPPALAQQTPGGRQVALEFQRNVVRVIPKTADGQDGAAGFGIVVGERNGKLFIATPDHVARGGGDEFGATPDVIFFAEQGRRFPGRRLEELRIPPAQGDLAVIEVAKPASFRAVTIGVAPPAAVPDAAPVWNVGRGGRWLVPTSPGGYQTLDAQTNHLLVEDLPTPPGSSGGAVLTERALLGMTLRDSGAQRLTYVFRADRIVEVFRGWQLPVNFITRVDPPQSTPRTQTLPHVAPAARPAPTPPSQQSPRPQRPPVTQAARPPEARAGDTCDRLAAQPDDPQRPGSAAPVTGEALRANAEDAIRACRTAAEQSPGVTRYGYSLARALLALGRSDDAFVAARRAAEAGHPRAQSLVGQMHERGRGTNVDYTQARLWYEKAAAQGDAEAKGALARMGQSVGSPFLRPSQR